MKKIIISLLVLILLLTTGCTNSGEENISLYEKGLDLINEVDKMASNQEVIELMSYGTESLEFINEIASYEYNEVKAVYEIGNALQSTFNYLENNSGTSLSKEASDIIKNRVIGIFPNTINISNGAQTMAVASILTELDAFNYNMDEDVKSYLYLFEGVEYPFIVSFMNEGDGVVISQANIIINNNFTSSNSIEELEAHLGNIGFEDIKLNEITNEW